MSDLIERWKVLNAIDSIESEIEDGYGFDYEKWKEHFAKMPSAEPEIIRCKDCKYRYMEDMIWHCPFGLMGGENFFCGYGSLETVVEDRYER